MKKTLAALTTTFATLVVLTGCSSATTEESTASSSSSGSSSTRSTASVPASSTSGGDGDGTPVTITAAGRTISATLDDSQVSQDFIATLPRTLNWDRNAGIEYITELDAPMTETGPFYTDVQAGDIVYYNPMDSVTIIYAPTSSVPTLTKMGEITSDLEQFKSLPDDVDMRIEVG